MDKGSIRVGIGFATWRKKLSQSAENLYLQLEESGADVSTGCGCIFFIAYDVKYNER
jgi:hypothetical protein